MLLSFIKRGVIPVKGIFQKERSLCGFIIGISLRTNLRRKPLKILSE
jgi:hypothetical protein